MLSAAARNMAPAPAPRTGGFAVWLLTLAGVALLLALAYWQLRRGEEQAALSATRSAALQAAPLSLHRQTAVPQGAQWLPAHARGVYDAAHQLLLDGQFHGETPGYHVWTPLLLTDGARVLVDRGWISLHAEGALDAPPGVVEISGLWRAPPAAAWRFAADRCRVSHWPQVVEYPNGDDLACLYGADTLRGVLLLDAAAPGGYQRDWTPEAALSPLRHYGYAVQWLALAVTLAVMSWRLRRRRS